MDDNEDYVTIVENENYLYDYLKSLFDKLAPIERWEQFKALAGEDMAEKLMDIVTEGPDPRNPA